MGARALRPAAATRPRRGLTGWLVLAVALVLCRPALGHAADAPEIVVTAPVPHVDPERSLDAAELDSYGESTVGGLLAQISTEEGGRWDDAVFLINGKRVASLGSAANLPAEAVVKIDVYPPGAGVAVGASPRQRVYDVRLTRKLDLGTATLAARVPTEGDWRSLRGELTYTHIRGERRINFGAKLRDDAMLLESERDVVQPGGSPAGAGRYRSLSPRATHADLSLGAADELAPWLSASLSSTLSLTRKHALLGPLAAPALAQQALDQRSRTEFATFDLTLNAQLGRWQLGLIGNHAYQDSRTATERQAKAATAPTMATTRSANRSTGIRASAFGPVLELPAGPITLNLGAGVSRDSIEGSTLEQASAVKGATTVATSDLTAAIEVPIASKATGFLAPLGDLSASVELGRQHASDFGSFSNRTFSLSWRPMGWLSLTGSLSRSDSAPPVATLDAPILATPGVRYFDPLRAETVDVTWITGGTPGLRRQSDESTRLFASLTPFRTLGFHLTAEYFELRNRNLVSELPLASLSVIQAFPERFVRDGDGRLTAVDARPLSLPGRTDRQLRSGFLLSLPLGRATRSGTLAEEGEETTAIRARPGRAAARPRVQLSLSHSWLLESKLAIRAGQPVIDLLSPRAVGFGGGGQPRHRVDASLGYAEAGLGARAGLQWRSASEIEATGASANTLRFHPLTTFGFRAWVQGERLAPQSTMMKGARLTLTIVNATGVRERVADRYGVTPLAYQPAYRDPIGRSVELQLRIRL